MKQVLIENNSFVIRDDFSQMKRIFNFSSYMDHQIIKFQNQNIVWIRLRTKQDDFVDIEIIYPEFEPVESSLEKALTLLKAEHSSSKNQHLAA